MVSGMGHPRVRGDVMVLERGKDVSKQFYIHTRGWHKYKSGDHLYGKFFIVWPKGQGPL
jgi:hypothetical protein